MSVLGGAGGPVGATWTRLVRYSCDFIGKFPNGLKFDIFGRS